MALRASTLGAGFELRKAISEKWAARGILNAYTYGIEEEFDDVEYDGDLELGSSGLLADFHPFGNSFRISGGIIFNRNELKVDARPSGGTYEFNDVVYTAAQIGSASGIAEFDDLSPYVGIGFAKSPRGARGFGVTVDLGVMFQGAPSFDLNVRCGAAVPAATCTQIQRDAEAERLQFEDDADAFEYYPTVGVGVSYRW